MITAEKQITVINNTLKIAREYGLEAEVMWSIIQDARPESNEDFRDICWAALGEWDCLKEDSNSILGFDEKLEEMKKYPHQDNHMD